MRVRLLSPLSPLLLVLVAALTGLLIGPGITSAASPAGASADGAITRSAVTPSSLNPFANVAVTGRATTATSNAAAAATSSSFTGHLTVQSFTMQHGRLVAHVLVTGVAGAQGVGPIAATMPATVTGTCQVLNLVLGPLHLNLLGLVVDLNQVTLTITAQQGPGLLLGNLVCAIANLLNGTGTPPGILAVLLNDLLGLIGHVFGGLSPHFTASSNQLMFNVSMNGSVVASTPATVTAPVSGTCSILTLDLGPLHLNLLGLVIDLSAVHLTITAQQAPGSLLGNLLCAIANLLNGTPPNLSAVANDLNLLLAILRL